MSIDLTWLPERQDWNAALSAATKQIPDAALPLLRELAIARIDFVQTAKLDRALQKIADAARGYVSARPVRLAILGSSTLAHLVPATRVGAFRRGLWLDVYEGEYGMYRQELADPDSELAAFKPDVLLLALDAHHLAGGQGASADGVLEQIQSCWALANAHLQCEIVQQTLLPVFPALLGGNEHRLVNSPHTIVETVNYRLRAAVDQAGVHLLALDTAAQSHGVREWFEPGLWHRSKQEVHPRVAHIYGDRFAAILAAIRGRSYKCLVLDLDNTLWGGVIGDDGLSGIVLGQGSAVGESYVAFQQFAGRLAARGIILAVCSKNDEGNALAPFEQHPEMVLKRGDISCFVANWEDKATNLRAIAKQLNIGLDAMVFADDNPFERNLIRQELPMVAVPELPEDPAEYISVLADAGYFESLRLTQEDVDRVQQYQQNTEREALREKGTDLPSYLRSLEMELVVNSFDSVGLPRIVQLINKTNQFNLTTRRYNESEVRAIAGDPNWLTLQLRLKDRFGDNGVISILMAQLRDNELVMDTWLMSCRVLGRQVEESALNILAARARELGATVIRGKYLPTEKNGMVKNHYAKLGFRSEGSGSLGETNWLLDLKDFQPALTLMRIVEGADANLGHLQEAH